MTDEAIKILNEKQVYAITGYGPHQDKLASNNALKLGIEALERLKVIRNEPNPNLKGTPTYRVVERCRKIGGDLLPDEAE